MRKDRYLLVFASMLLSLNACAIAPTSHFSVHVEDENSVPLEGVKVMGYFSTLMYDYTPGSNTKSITNSEGNAKISGPAYFSVDVDANKKAYYESEKKIEVNKIKDHIFSILLRAKKNPIEMYAKHFIGYLPKSKIKIAFDFTKGDWVIPYGMGTNKDIYFYYDGFVNSTFHYEGELRISFPSETDGVVELEYENGKYSKLKLPYEAPETGYVKSKLLVHKRIVQGSSAHYEMNFNKSDNFGYFLKVRSKDDLAGNVSIANYVKIAGEIIFDPRTDGRGAAYIDMTYYFNPSINDRNTEFDPEKNLFKNLYYLEEVGAP